MSVIVQTTLGDFIIDLFFEKCPKTCENFLGLCKIKYFNNLLFFNIQKDFIAQSGDPTNTGKEGKSIYYYTKGENFNYFPDEISKNQAHNKKGLLSMYNKGKNTNTSQFFITLTGRHLDYLDKKHTIFGEIVENLEIIDKLNDVYIDEKGKPYQEVRIIRTIILIDPFEKENDKIAKFIPERSPSPIRDKHLLGIGEKEEDIKIDKSETKAKTALLEIAGDLPDSDMKPPDSTLFVCKLNTITSEESLDIIFSRFGQIKSLNLVRDKDSGKSLGFAFIDFESKDACEQAYLKMENVLIDDRRIHVDFSQSVAKLWAQSQNKRKRGNENLKPLKKKKDLQ